MSRDDGTRPQGVVPLHFACGHDVLIQIGPDVVPIELILSASGAAPCPACRPADKVPAFEAAKWDLVLQLVRAAEKRSFRG